MTTTCPHPLIIHRGFDIIECPDPDCAAIPPQHTIRLPCRWACPYAHGRAGNTHPFPAGQCPACYHIPRAGKAQELAAPPQPARTP